MMKGQGAIESAALRSPTARTLLGQGATEYLVLLAVVLIIALVGVALLGFFPGTASDAQEQESRLYWQSASPVSVTETVMRRWDENITFIIELRVRNNGAYPIRITRLYSEGTWTNETTNGPSTIDTPIDTYVAPGEEKFLIHNPSGPGTSFADAWTGMSRTYAADSGWHDHYVRAAQVCSTPQGGWVVLKRFGFEYTQYVEGQSIVKQQIGSKELIARCTTGT